jgi:hypothetical protein
MRMSTVLLLVVALAGAGVSTAFWRELRAERALNADLSARLDAAIVARAVAPPPETPSAAKPVSTAPAAAASATTLFEPTPQPKVTQDSQEGWQAYQRRLMRDPKYRDAWREEQRLQFAQRHDNYIKLLGFTPEQADAAIDLAIDRQISMVDHSQVGSKSEDAQQLLRERFEADERAYQGKLRELLGEEKYTQLQTYMDSRQSRMQVDRFRTQLIGGDALRDDQVEPLISALYLEHSQMQKDLQDYRESLGSETDQAAALRKLSERETELMKAAQSRMHSAASGILGSTQLDKFDAMLKRDLERHEAQQRMARIRSKIDPPTDPKGGSN